MRRIGLSFAALLLGAAVSSLAWAQPAKKYGPGVSDKEIKLGQSIPYSGRVPMFGAMGKAEAAYFEMINEQGGVNGRKIKLISLDDSNQDTKALDATKELVEQEQVLAIVGTMGIAANTGIRDYLNERKVPQLFIASVGGREWGDPAHYPWTMSWQPTHWFESYVYARYIKQALPNAKVAVLYQNENFGREALQGLIDGFGPQASNIIVKTVSHESSDFNVDAPFAALQSSGANVLVNLALPRVAVGLILKIGKSDWRPTQFLTSLSTYPVVMKGLGANAKGVITASYMKDPNDKVWANDPAVQAWAAWMKRYNPSADPRDQLNVQGYLIAMTMVQVLRQCGDDLTRANVMKQAANLKRLALPMLLPGITVNTAPNNFYPIRQMQLQRFDGENWILFGNVIDG